VVDDVRRTVTRTAEGAWLDTGGFGKGAALRAAAAALAGAGIRDAALNFGGQLLVVGRDADGTPWPVPVAHPSARTRPAALLWASGRSVSTSSQSERPGHILDPRTGRPVPAWGSVTVVAKDPAVADMLSTALFVMGPEAGLAWARGRTDVGVLFLVEERGRLRRRWNSGMRAYLADVAGELVTDSPSTDSIPGG
jgi:thiamine biosynthesis lipoprotein